MANARIDPKALPVGLGLPGWAWPLIGLSTGILLVMVVYGTCFVDPKCK